MTISFPIDMPVGGVVSQYFEVQRQDNITPVGRGAVGSIQSGFPLWKNVITLGNTSEDETGDWSSFVSVLRGASRQFLGFDLTRPYPRAYANGFGGMTRHGGGSFDGSATSWSVNTTRDVLTLNGMPDGFAIAKRDYVGFTWTGSKYAMVRAVEAATASAGTIAFTVEPPVPGGADYVVVPDDATAYLNNPKCLMRLVVGDTNLGAQDVLHTLGGTISAIQDLRQ